MKPICIFVIFTLCFFSCENKYNEVFQSETDEHFAIIQDEITSLPKIPINFYWELPMRDQLTNVTPVTSCLTTEVRFEKPYIIANGVKFHAYYWTRTQNKLVGPNLAIESMSIAFDHEK